MKKSPGQDIFIGETFSLKKQARWLHPCPHMCMYSTHTHIHSHIKRKQLYSNLNSIKKINPYELCNEITHMLKTKKYCWIKLNKIYVNENTTHFHGLEDKSIKTMAQGGSTYSIWSQSKVQWCFFKNRTYPKIYMAFQGPWIIVML